MPHQDGPIYFPVVAIVSLGSPAVMRFVPHQSIAEAKEEIHPTSTGRIGEPPSELRDAQNGGNDSYDQFMPKQENAGAVEDHEKSGDLRTQTWIQRTSPKDVSVILMPGSLLLFKGSAYQEYLHGIEDCVEHKLDVSVVNAQTLMDGDNGRKWSLLKEQEMSNGRDYTLQRTGTRISLTCRLVPKVRGKFLRL